MFWGVIARFGPLLEAFKGTYRYVSCCKITRFSVFLAGSPTSVAKEEEIYLY